MPYVNSYWSNLVSHIIGVVDTAAVARFHGDHDMSPEEYTASILLTLMNLND